MITEQQITSTFWIMIISYIITLFYSVYMAFLNHKQAKVKDILIETNKILKNIENLLKNNKGG